MLLPRAMPGASDLRGLVDLRYGGRVDGGRHPVLPHGRAGVVWLGDGTLRVCGPKSLSWRPKRSGVEVVGVRGCPWVRCRRSSAAPIVDEWSIAVVRAHFAAAFVALDAAGAPDDGDRPFHYGLTFERDLVLRVARSLLRRISPLAA